jgi:DNA-binding transcriptional regulator LsrR (DeoR family)
MKKASKNEKKERHDPIEIKIALLRRGITQTAIAKKLGISKHTVNKYINRGDKSARVEREINKILEEDKQKAKI